MSANSDWQNGIVNRNYFILENLEKDDSINKIISVDFLPISLKPGLKYYYHNLLFNSKNKQIIYGDMTSACYKATDKIYVYSSVDSVWSPKTISKELNKIIKKLNLDNLIVWSYNPMFLDFLNKLNYEQFVFDTVDNWTEHKAYLKLIKKKKLMNNYKKIAAKADYIFTVSDELTEFYKQFGREDNVHWIPNGVDYHHYTNDENLQKQTVIDDEKRKIIGYIGTIQDRIDFDLIKFIAQKNEDKLIVLAGPIWKNVKKEIKNKLELLENVKFLGRIKFEYAPSYINKFDVCIIPHKLTKFVQSMNPMKMYEYLALGKPVVTTEGAGVNNFKELLYIAKDKQEFNSFINHAINETDKNLKLKRQEAAKKHDWINKTNKMLKIINK